jgi:hypothetical protein
VYVRPDLREKVEAWLKEHRQDILDEALKREQEAPEEPAQLEEPAQEEER